MHGLVILKFSRYYFHAKTNILADFQICISVLLILRIVELYTRTVGSFSEKVGFFLMYSIVLYVCKQTFRKRYG